MPPSNQENRGINPHAVVAEALEFAAEMVDTGIVEFISSALIGSVYLSWGFNYHAVRNWMEDRVVEVIGINRLTEDKMTKNERVMVLCMAAALAWRAAENGLS